MNELNYNADDCSTINLTIKTEKVEAKERKIKPMKWWYVYKFFNDCPPFWYTKILIQIERFIRFIIRKPVHEAPPKFEIGDIVCIHSKNVEKDLNKIILNEVKGQ